MNCCDGARIVALKNPREQDIADRIDAAGLLKPVSISIGRGHHSVAVAFIIGDAVETIEGRGDTDAEMADDIIRQLRELLRRTTG
jgi:hypothetical protein